MPGWKEIGSWIKHKGCDILKLPKCDLTKNPIMGAKFLGFYEH